MQKVFRTGNSIAVVIPAKFAQVVGIHSGDRVKVITKPEVSRITIVFEGSGQLPLTLPPKKKSRKKLT